MPALDGLRGVAILLVVLDHGQVSALRGAGGAGVTLFFVLSGFLITGLLLREHDLTGRIDLRSFYLRRARRLLPALVAFLVVVVAYYGSIAAPSAVVTILYVANVPAAGSETALFFPLHHMWSLAVEEQFYLVWPLGLILLIHLCRGRRPLVSALLGLALAALVVRVAGYPLFGYDWTYRSTPANLFPLLAGAAVATVVHRTTWAASRLMGLVGATTIAAVALAPVPPSEEWMIVRTLVAAGAAALLLTRSDAWMRHAPLRYCGRVSYGWYLWHVLFQTELGGLEGALLSFGVAVLSFHLWESLWTDQRANRSANAIRVSPVG